MSEEQLSLAERYVLETPIAEGGMATVWRARDDVLARTVTVKILHSELAVDPSFVENFRTEALAAARLAHPNIVAIYDTGNEGPDDSMRHFIVMEYCGGGNLADLLKGNRTLELQEVHHLASQICGALDYAHSEGVIHRDIKPQNVLFNEQSVAKVGDFGIARSAFDAGDLTTTTSLLGNVTYISPEQVRGGEIGPRSDIYSLAALLYRCLAGRPPFEGSSALAVARAHVEEEPPPLRSIRADVPKAVDAAILRALQKDPLARPASTNEFLNDLRDAIDPGGGTRVLPRSVPALPPSPRVGRSQPWIAVALLAAVALTAVGVLTLLGGEQDGGGERSDNDDGRSGDVAVLRVQDASDFDPHGDGSEHPDEVELAMDGDPSTMWTTQTYRDPLSVFKPEGLGLWFDLGEPREVSEIDVVFDEPGYGIEIRAGDSLGDTEQDLEIVRRIDAAEQNHTEALDEPTQARFWVIWLKTFPGDRAGQGAIAEVRFFGR